MNTRFSLLVQRVWTMRMWRQSPLMRASYRAQYLVGMIIVLMALLALPAAVSLGTAVDHSVAARGDRLRSILHTEPATLDADPQASDPRGESPTAPAHWSVGAVTHTGTISVDTAAKKGDPVTIWVWPDGTQATEPPTANTAVSYGILAAMAAFGGVVAILLSASAGLHVLLDRKRRESWAREWDALAGDRKWNLR